MGSWKCTPEMKICLSDSLLQLVPTCIIVFSSLAFISAECGKQDRRRHFNQFSSEVVVQGESQTELDPDESSSGRLIKPRRTFTLAILRCLGSISQVGLYTYLAFEKLNDPNHGTPMISPNNFESFSEYKPQMKDANDEWPLWLPVMHGIVWVYATILSIVSLLHPRLSNPYKLTTHLDIIYVATAGAALAHFMVYNFGRPLGLWTLDDHVSGLSGLVSGSMLILTLATKPLVPPQPIKGPERKSRGIVSPETRSSIYARIAFTWLHPMVIKSLKGKLQETDVWAMDRALRIKTVFQDYLENSGPTVFVTMLHLFRFELTQQFIWALTWAGLGMVPPFVVFKLISFAQDVSTYNRNEAMFYVASLLASIVIRSAVLQHGLHLGNRIGTKAMGMSSGLIYEKMVLRKDMDPADYDISDLMAVDVKRIGNGWKYCFCIMMYPVIFIFATIQLYGYIGHSAWVGGMAAIAWYPISALASFLFSGRFDTTPPKLELSNALVSDFLANLKAVKYLGWERILINNILKARESERKLNSRISPVLALVSVPLGADLVQAFVMTVILTAYSIFFGQVLTPAILFTTLILVDLQTGAINSLPADIYSFKEMLDSVVRVNNFLSDDENERDTAIIKDREMARRANIPVIGFVSATFIWPVAKPAHHKQELFFVDEPEDDDSNNGASGSVSQRNRRSQQKQNSQSNSNWVVRTLSLFGYSLPTQPTPYPTNGHQKFSTGPGHTPTDEEDFVLKNLTLSFPPGQISVVTGTKRSGKSALLLALIGEMTRTSGKIYLPRKDYYHGQEGYGSDVAYVGQDPWLEIGGGGLTESSTGRSTIRDTILFGKIFDVERYSQILKACVLEDELQGLPNADLTIIGDKNVVWSMSLKQRISLARAVYSGVSHVLIDDCLSFVDVKSRQFIWKNCLLGPLMENKTRIIVTNQFHVKTYLNDADYVVGLDQGVVLGHGTVKDVLSQGWIRQAPGSSSVPTTIIPGASVPANMNQLPPRVDQPADNPSSNVPSQELKPSKSSNLPLNKMSSLSDYDDLDSTLSRETAAGFKVGWTTFGTYIFSLGSFFFLISAFMSLFLSQAMFVMRVGWLGVWAENEAWADGVPLQTTIHHQRHQRSFLDDPSSEPAVNHFDYLLIFAALAVARALFVLANAFFMRNGAYTGEDRIYAKLISSIAAARLTVFEPNAEKAAKSLPGDAGGLFSKGTINGLKDCFQRDLGGLDVKLAKEFWKFSSDLLAGVLILGILTAIYPIILIPVVVVIVMLVGVAFLGLGLSKEMHRMAIRSDRMNKDQFKHMFRGLSTIRGYGLERRAVKAGLAQTEFYLKTKYFGGCADRWLHWKVELSSAIIPFSCAVLALYRLEDLDPVLMGLSLYLSLQFSNKALHTVHGWGRIRNRLQWALERTRRYISELDQPNNKESPKVIPENRPPAAWPHGGSVEYINYACTRSETFHIASPDTSTVNNVPSSLPVTQSNTSQPRTLPPNAIPPRDQSLQANQGNNNVRTNTGVSAVNSSISNISLASASSQNNVTTDLGNPSSSENSIATLIPLPTPSGTFRSANSGISTEAAPMDQLAALDQTEALDTYDITSGNNIDNRYEAPLPPLPPSKSKGNMVAKNMNNQMTAALTDSTHIGFGPVTCSILPGEKIAVIGQSKSGKGTFVQSLFRIWDSAEEEMIRASNRNNIPGSKRTSTQRSVSPSPATSRSISPLRILSSRNDTTNIHDVDLGIIKIDGLDIGQLGLSDLRSRLAYLSQRGTVFAGTVRFNLDPKGEHGDSELNDVLKTCFLSDRLKLDTELITPSTATLSRLSGPGSANTSAPLSRLARYKKRFFRRSRANQLAGKGKSKKDPKPFTIGATSGRHLRAALEEGSHEAEERLLSSFDDEHPVNNGGYPYDDDEDEEEEEDDTRVELDTNERQLLSLARILVQRSNVVVLDNCASKVTDLTAQRMDQIVLQELKQATVISVGHRLDQIVARHNRILVLDHGKIAEFDSPIALLNKPNGVFRSICNPDGPNFSSLVSLAKKQQTQLQQQLQPL